jgi:hypothetical protein
MTSLTDINIQAFAEAVRAELADLPKREIQDLTDGLEADLAEKFAEEGVDFSAVSASDYAAELRDAAGVAPKSPRRSAFSSKVLIQNTEEWFRKTAFGTGILEFGISIRPVWWVLRALVIWFIFAGSIYSFTSGAILIPIFILISIQLGRKKWLTGKFFAALVLPLNLIAVLLLLPAQGMLMIKLNNYAIAEEMLRTMPGSDGLRYNGEPVTQLRAFDADSQEVIGLSFEDQRGQKIEIPTTGVAYFPIPELLGKTSMQAQQALTLAGIENVDFIYLDGVTDVNGVVVAVNPSQPGAMVTEFDVVELTLGKSK